MKTFILIVVCFLANVWAMHGQIAVDYITDKLPLTNKVEALKTDKNASFQSILQQDNWQKFTPKFEASRDSAIWLKFKLKNNSQESVLCYLYSIDQHTTVYQKINGNFKKMDNGYFLPMPQRVNKTVDYFIPISVAAQENSLVYVRLLRVYNTNLDNTPTLYSEEGYLKHYLIDFNEQTKSIGFLYFYIISIFTIIIFAIVFWFRLREKLYTYYLGYLFFQLIYGFTVLRSTLAPVGNIFQYQPSLSIQLFEPVQFTFIGFYIFFIIKLLKVEDYDKLLAKILTYLGWACFIYAVVRFGVNLFTQDHKIASIVFLIVRIIILPINFVLIFWIIYKVKHPLLIYFIFGQSFFFIGALLGSYIGAGDKSLLLGGIFNFKEAPNIIFQIGLLAEVYCFSLALGQNVFLLQKEKAKANKKLIAQLQENKLLQENMNRRLDNKIHDKTAELIELYSEIEREKEEKIKREFTQRIKETEMIALRSQMNPHFIFNSLNAIKHLIMTSRNDDASIYLDDFSSLLRGILQNSDRKKISVEEELEILELYLSLEQNRMGSQFIYNIEANDRDTLSQYQIPPLLLQPLVENAIWHGLQPSLKAEKRLDIIFDTAENLKIIIEDNGIGRKESAKRRKLHASVGTQIVEERLTLHNHLNENTIRYKIIDLEEDGRALGTRIILTYQY